MLLAYTHLYPSEVPFVKLLQIANDQSEADRVRELAVLAASYGPEQKVCDDINALAVQVGHPGWKPAVSRLGDIGSGYDLKVLRGQNPEDEGLQKILQRSIKLIVDREAALLKDWQSKKQESEYLASTRVYDAESKLSRLVDARLQKRTNVGSLQQWTIQYFKQIGKPNVVIKSLNQLMNRQQKDDFTDQRKAVIQTVIEELSR